MRVITVTQPGRPGSRWGRGTWWPGKECLFEKGIVLMWVSLELVLARFIYLFICIYLLSVVELNVYKARICQESKLLVRHFS